MKKAVSLLMLFLVVTMIAGSLTLLTAEKAHAIATYIYCSRTTGAQCPDPAYPYYLYMVDRYGQHFVGCCNGLIDL